MGFYFRDRCSFEQIIGIEVHIGIEARQGISVEGDPSQFIITVLTHDLTDRIGHFGRTVLCEHGDEDRVVGVDIGGVGSPFVTELVGDVIKCEEEAVRRAIRVREGVFRQFGFEVSNQLFFHRYSGQFSI